jgi:type IV pilus assembly protein PilM
MQAVLGLDIGTSRIKFVEARAGRRGPLITAAGIGLTPRDTISNGVIVDPDTLGAAIRQLLEQHGVKTRAVISSVASQSSLVVRPIEVPRMTRQELAQTMQFEVERHIPFAASEVVMDFQPMVPPEQLPAEATNMEVLLAVAQEDMINNHVQALLRANLQPSVLDVEPLAACRSLIDINADEGSYDHTYALLNVGANTTDLSIIRRGVLSFTRPVPNAGDQITQAVADALGYEFHEAERLKLEHAALYVEHAPALPETSTQREYLPTQAPAPPPPLGREPEEGVTFLHPPEEDTDMRPVFDLGGESAPIEVGSGVPPAPPPTSLPSLHTPSVGTPQRQVYDAILPIVADLVGEVRRSIDYYANRFPDSRVDKILLYGGTASIKSFAEFLGTQVGVPVAVGNPFLRVEVDRHVDPAIVQEQACFMPIVVGLAIRDMIG